MASTCVLARKRKNLIAIIEDEGNNVGQRKELTFAAASTQCKEPYRDDAPPS